MIKDAPGKAKDASVATGREIHARLARSGPPLEITTRGLRVRRQPRMSIEKALAARPEGKETDQQG